MRISDCSSDVCSSDLSAGSTKSAAASGTPAAMNAISKSTLRFCPAPFPRSSVERITRRHPIAVTLVFRHQSSAEHVLSQYSRDHFVTRSEKGLVGKECVSTLRSRCWQYHKKKT